MFLISAPCRNDSFFPGDFIRLWTGKTGGDKEKEYSEREELNLVHEFLPHKTTWSTIALQNPANWGWSIHKGIENGTKVCRKWFSVSALRRYILEEASKFFLHYRACLWNGFLHSICKRQESGRFWVKCKMHLRNGSAPCLPSLSDKISKWTSGWSYLEQFWAKPFKVFLVDRLLPSTVLLEFRTWDMPNAPLFYWLGFFPNFRSQSLLHTYVLTYVRTPSTIPHTSDNKKNYVGGEPGSFHHRFFRSFGADGFLQWPLRNKLHPLLR